MGRKKIQISRITDERNRQVRVINVCYSTQLVIGNWIFFNSKISLQSHCHLIKIELKRQVNETLHLYFPEKQFFGNYILMCHSYMEMDLKYKDPLLALKLSLINFWPLEFSFLWSVSIKFNTFQKPQGHTL